MISVLRHAHSHCSSATDRSRFPTMSSMHCLFVICYVEDPESLWCHYRERSSLLAQVADLQSRLQHQQQAAAAAPSAGIAAAPSAGIAAAPSAGIAAAPKPIAASPQPQGSVGNSSIASCHRSASRGTGLSTGKCRHAACST